MLTNSKLVALENAVEKAMARCEAADYELASAKKGIDFARHQLSLPDNQTIPQQEFYTEILEREEGYLPEKQLEAKHAKQALDRAEKALKSGRRQYFESLGLVVADSGEE